MATAVAVKPATDILTRQQSLNMLKNTLRVGISSIAYLRNFFEEDVFSEATISGLTLKQMKPTHPEAKMILEWLNSGVFDALEKRYLRLLVLGVHSPDDELLECYHFSFKYTEDDSEFTLTYENPKENINGDNIQVKSPTKYSKEEAKRQSIQLLRSLILLTQSFGPLPESRYISMKLWYYDENTPDDYEPIGFMSAKEEDQLRFRSTPVEIAVGKIEGSHHRMSVRVKTTCDEELSNQDEDNSEQLTNGEVSLSQLQSTGKKLCSSYERIKRCGTVDPNDDAGSLDLKKQSSAIYGLSQSQANYQSDLYNSRPLKSPGNHHIKSDTRIGDAMLNPNYESSHYAKPDNSYGNESAAEVIYLSQAQPLEEQIEKEINRLFYDAKELAKVTKYLRKDNLAEGIGVEGIVAKPLLEKLIEEGILSKKVTRGRGYESLWYKPIQSAYKQPEQEILKRGDQGVSNITCSQDRGYSTSPDPKEAIPERRSKRKR